MAKPYALTMKGAAALCAAGLIAAYAGLAMAPAASAADAPSLASALGVSSPELVSASSTGDTGASSIVTDKFGIFPTAGNSYAILSTGKADEVLGGAPSDFISTNLGNGGGVDGNDLTSLTLDLLPPTDAKCMAFDFQFLSEEYPEFVGSSFNDIFTAEQNESKFFMENDQVVAPNNFAYDSKGNFVSVNTVFGFTDATGTRMDGTTPPLVAVTPLERDVETGKVKLILTIQDIGDSIYDSAVLVDNLRWLYGSNCDRSVSSLVDSDGDGLPDVWETEGIDYDGDGIAEVNLSAMGADPQRADIFIQVDWMEKKPSCVWFICWGGKSFEPQQAALNDVVKAFAAAPFTNPNGSTGITAHISSGSAVPWTEHILTASNAGYDWTGFEGIKNSSFDNLKRDVFHYALYADTLLKDNGSSGISRGLPGADFILTDGHKSWEGGFSRIQERGTFMHELGHNLSLMHGGPDHTTYAENPSFLSVMNYSYQLTGIGGAATLDYSRGEPYADWAHLVFNGGSIGDLGDSAPVLITEPMEEMTAEDYVPLQGDGAFIFDGPSVLATSTKGQFLFATINNPAPAATEYLLSASTTEGTLIGKTTVVVPGGGQFQVKVPVDSAALTATGTLKINIELTSNTLKDLVAQQGTTVEVVDLTDPKVLADGKAALAELSSSQHDINGAVLTSIKTLFDGPQDQIPSPTPSPTPTDSPSPSPTHTDSPSPTTSQASGEATPSTVSSVVAQGNHQKNELSSTGASSIPIMIGGTLLLVIGAGTVILVRRKHGYH
ncbi:choice-of-anchor L domain-containing protein [Arthrobacter psychrochitiniphilus]|nr:choice-of-anchor L domain-containing protein [Arthrobacter psychrochitiniphilus]NYG15979.1 hypothetical protein [Arthrobacter psychrochitiniphilus]